MILIGNDRREISKLYLFHHSGKDIIQLLKQIRSGAAFGKYSSGKVSVKVCKAAQLLGNNR